MLAALRSVPPGMFVVFAGLLGAIVGSFVNAAIYRLPRGISLITRTRSFCPACEAQIAWYDNLPVLSYLLLRGKCRACQWPIPVRYLLVEVLTAALFAFAAYQYFVLNRPAAGGLSRMPFVLLAVQLLLVADLLCLTFTDLETWYIPIETTWPWIVLGLVLAPFFPELHPVPCAWTGSAWVNSLLDSVQGLILGTGLLWVAGFLCVVFLRKEGMGLGDCHLLGLIGALFGWRPVLATLFLGALIGSVLGLAAMLWDALQRVRVGEQHKPHQPAFELPEGEPGGESFPDWILLALGILVLAFEAGVLYLHQRLPPVQEEEFLLLSAVLGGMVGAVLLLAYPVSRHLHATQQWPHGEVQVREDGTKQEVLHGHYIPFGPSLALAGLVVAFYYPVIHAWAVWYLLGVWPAYPFRMLGAP